MKKGDLVSSKYHPKINGLIFGRTNLHIKVVWFDDNYSCVSWYDPSEFYRFEVINAKR